MVIGKIVAAAAAAAVVAVVAVVTAAATKAAAAVVAVVVEAIRREAQTIYTGARESSACGQPQLQYKEQ
jgi:hypothetical protein